MGSNLDPIFVYLLVFAFFDLTLDSVQSLIYSLLKCSSTLLGYDISARNMKCYKCNFVSLFIIFFKSKNDIYTGRTVCKSLQS